MSARSTVTVTCDDPACDRVVVGGLSEPAQAIRFRLAHDEGWQVAPPYRGKPDYCAEHRRDR